MLAAVCLLTNSEEQNQDLAGVDEKLYNIQTINTLNEWAVVEKEEAAGEEGYESGKGTNSAEWIQMKEETFPVEKLQKYNEAEHEEVMDSLTHLLQNNEEAYEDLEIIYTAPIENARITSDFGTRTHPVSGEEIFHSGIDFAARKGTTILAAADGTVRETGFDKSVGKYVILQHINGEMTYYTCCEEVLVKQGDEVKAGSRIATVGNSGASTGAHLHFALSRNGEYIKPVL